MAQQTEALLRKAVAQIRAGKLNKARPSLVDLLRREPNNEQAWYLLSFALEDPQRQQYALLQALKVNSEFEKARVRLAKLRGEPLPSPAPTSPFTEVPAPELANASTPIESTPEDQLRSVPTFFEETPEEEKSAEQIQASIETRSAEKPRKRGSFGRTFFIIVVFLFLAVLGFFVATTIFSGVLQPTATPTTLATQTLPATWTPTIEPTATATTAPTRTSSPTPEPTGTLTGSETVTQ